MRHLIAFVLAVPLLLAGCQTTSAPDVVPVDPVISTAQRYVQEKCGFVPDPGVISSLLKFFSPNSAGFLEMAQKICAVVAAPHPASWPTLDAAAPWCRDHREFRPMTAPRRNLARHRLGNARHGGWMPDRPKTGKDWRFDTIAPRSLALPDMPTCNSAFFPRIKDQKNLGSCTGESASYGVEYCVLAKLAGEGQDVQSAWWKKWGLSGLAGYYWAREIERDDQRGQRCPNPRCRRWYPQERFADRKELALRRQQVPSEA
jgi:hypothetical protein